MDRTRRTTLNQMAAMNSKPPIRVPSCAPRPGISTSSRCGSCKRGGRFRRTSPHRVKIRPRFPTRVGTSATARVGDATCREGTVRHEPHLDWPATQPDQSLYSGVARLLARATPQGRCEGRSGGRQGHDWRKIRSGAGYGRRDAVERGHGRGRDPGSTRATSLNAATAAMPIRGRFGNRPCLRCGPSRRHTAAR